MFKKKIIGIAIVDRSLQVFTVHTLRGFQSKKTPCLRLKTLKTIPCSAAHTSIGQIREYPPPLGTVYGSFELTYLDQTKHC